MNHMNNSAGRFFKLNSGLFIYYQNSNLENYVIKKIKVFLN